MLHVKEYNIAEGLSAYELAEDVNDMIRRGWQPFGSLTVTFRGSNLTGMVYAQAMVKAVEQI